MARLGELINRRERSREWAHKGGRKRKMKRKGGLDEREDAS